MVLIRVASGEWIAELASFDVPLKVGLPIQINASALQFKPELKRSSIGTLSCELVKWQYVIDSREKATLELIVREVHEPLLDRIFRTDESRFHAAVILAIVLSVVAAIGYACIRYLPDATLALAGRHARTFGGWALFLVVAFVLPRLFGLYRGFGFKQVFFQALFLYLGIAIAFAWLSIARLPPYPFGYTDPEFASYARNLWKKLSANYWPAIAVAIPWLLIAFKTFGIELSEKTSKTVLEVVKTKE